MKSLQKESDCCENCIGYENEWTPENLVCCKEDCMCHSQKIYSDCFFEECAMTQKLSPKQCQYAIDYFSKFLSSAIATAVSNREKEIAEEVKKLYSLDYMKGSPASYINRALDKVLQIIKH